MNLKDYKNKLLENEDFRKEYNRFDLVFEIKQWFIELKSIIKRIFN